MNPFGLHYGYIDYLGAGSSDAEMKAGWSSMTGCRSSLGGWGSLVLRRRPESPLYLQYWWAIHELSHAYFGAPDYYDTPGCFEGNVTCALLDCFEQSAGFSASGQDAARYWALTDKRARQ